jgi:hypothetical protein
MLPANPQQGRRPTLFSAIPAGTLGKISRAYVAQAKKRAAKGEETRCPEFPNRGRRPSDHYVALPENLQDRIRVLPRALQ